MFSFIYKENNKKVTLIDNLYQIITVTSIFERLQISQFTYNVNAQQEVESKGLLGLGLIQLSCGRKPFALQLSFIQHIHDLSKCKQHPLEVFLNLLCEKSDLVAPVTRIKNELVSLVAFFSHVDCRETSVWDSDCFTTSLKFRQVAHSTTVYMTNKTTLTFGFIQDKNSNFLGGSPACVLFGNTTLRRSSSSKPDRG